MSAKKIKKVIYPNSVPDSVAKWRTEWGQKETVFLSPIALLFSVPYLIFIDNFLTKTMQTASLQSKGQKQVDQALELKCENREKMC